MTKQEYREYLKSDEWRTQRRSALVFARNRCQVCNGRNKLDVHHRTYERLGNEDPSDLTVLCRACHELFHDRLPDPPKHTAPMRAPRACERRLLGVMSRGVEWVERAAEQVSAEDFVDPHYRAVFQAFLDDPEMRAPPASMDPVAARRLEEILADPEEVAHGIDAFTRSLNRIRQRVTHPQERER